MDSFPPLSSHPSPVNINAALTFVPLHFRCFCPSSGLSPGWQPPQWFLEPSLLSLTQPCRSCQGCHPKERPPCHFLSLKPAGTLPPFATGQSQGSYTRSTQLSTSAPAHPTLVQPPSLPLVPSSRPVCAWCSCAWHSSPLSSPALRAGVLSLRRALLLRLSALASLEGELPRHCWV